MSFKCGNAPNETYALTNKVFTSPEDFVALRNRIPEEKMANPTFLKISDYYFAFEGLKDIPKGIIGLNVVQRRLLRLSLGEGMDAVPVVVDWPNSYLSSLKLEAEFLNTTQTGTVEREKIEEIFKGNFLNQFFTVEQKLLAEVAGFRIVFRVVAVECVDLASLASPEKRSSSKGTPPSINGGILHRDTTFDIVKSANTKLNLTGGSQPSHSIPLDWNFEKMGIGGLDREFNDIFRRAFASRLFPPSIIKKLGISHVKGILLYGPPGTGKTLIARQIGKMLNARPPKIVNGPEILNKYVGESEKNIRELFKDAETDQEKNGEGAGLHIIIFDEIDAICRQRGSRNDGTGVGDTVVNQLLSKMDGVDSLSNVLVIGMTNRKDLIDEALLRPGRFEVHMEINLPDEKGRVQIFAIHTSKLRENKALAPDVKMEDLAKESKNFSGAEIEGVVKSATSFAFNRQIDVSKGVKIKGQDVVVTRQDFAMALTEIKPAFGIADDELQTAIPNGIIEWSNDVSALFEKGRLFVEQVRNSDRTPLVSVLLEGSQGSGKTSIAVQLAKTSNYPFVKIISPDLLVNYSEAGKCARITKIFDDAHKSPLSFIILDDLERLIDYVRIGPRFSNSILQTLLVLIRKSPPKGRRLLIVGTTSNKRVIEDTELLSVFDVLLTAPQITTQAEFKKVLQELNVLSSNEKLEEVARNFKPPISIKRLIMLTEMAKQERAEAHIVKNLIEGLNSAFNGM